MSRPSITIRAAVPADAAAIAAIHCASWRDAYADVLDPAYLAGPVEADRLALWRARFDRPAPTQVVLVAEAGTRELAGFLCLYRDADERWGSLIDNLHVHPALRGQAIGDRLLRAAAALLEPNRPFHLWVFASNAGGIRFYDRLGGTVAERCPSEMPAARGADVLRMVWSGADRLTIRD